MNKAKKIIYIVIGVLVFVLVMQVVAADKYKALVQVIEEEGKMGVNPLTDKLDFGDLNRESTAIRYVTIENNGGMKNYIMIWKFGGISELIDISKNNFTIEPGEKERLEFQIVIPVSAENKYYNGSVWIFKIPQVW
ncbi:unnamed protein product [marine sediment metagenome]|uniref:Uncharacterized protein n=1 Tax=marine sediment metagenome TaxID=412755 RepID=X1T4E3_9ZZZZ